MSYSSSSCNDNDNEEEKGTCCICLEALLSGESSLGATVPCGHVFHNPCLEQLAAFRRGTCAAKCPMCNTSPVTFVKLFLDIPSNAALSSSSSILVNSDSNDDDEAVTDEKYRALRQQAAQYRQKLQQAKENLAKQAKRLQRHQAEVDQVYTQLDETVTEVEQQTKLVEQERRQVEALKLETVQLQNACKSLEWKLEQAQNDAQNARLDLSQAKARHAMQLKEAKEGSMHEMNVLMKRQPQLEQQIRSLQLQNKKLKKIVQQDVPQQSINVSSNNNSNGSKQKRKMLQSLGAAPSYVSAAENNRLGHKTAESHTPHPSQFTHLGSKASTFKPTPPQLASSNSSSRNERASSILSVLDQIDKPKIPVPRPKLNIPERYQGNKKQRIQAHALGGSSKLTKQRRRV